jgi:hypothetical protein
MNNYNLSSDYDLYIDATGTLCMRWNKYITKEVTGVSEVCLHLLFLIK